jgi:hypothetical protein
MLFAAQDYQRKIRMKAAELIDFAAPPGAMIRRAYTALGPDDIRVG